MISLLKKLITVLTVAVFCTFPVKAQSDAESFNPDNATIDEQLTQNVVPEKALQPLIRHLDKIGAAYQRHGLEVRKERRGDVLTVIVPVERLFSVNDTVLVKGAARVLGAFRDLLKQPSLYKVLVIVHSDDTGSDCYANALTESRANVIDDYYNEMFGGERLNIVPYGVGKDEALVPNTSIVSRQRNRRVEFMIIPEKQLIEQARSGKL